MSRLLTWLLRLLPALGIVLALIGAGVFGALPDEWWDVKSFVVNIVSAFVAACFGLPIAFFVLQRLLREREAWAHRAEVVERAEKNLVDIETEMYKLLGSANPRYVGFDISHIDKLLASYSTAATHWFKQRQRSDFANSLERAADIRRELERLVASYDKVAGSDKAVTSRALDRISLHREAVSQGLMAAEFDPIDKQLMDRLEELLSSARLNNIFRPVSEVCIRTCERLERSERLARKYDPERAEDGYTDDIAVNNATEVFSYVALPSWECR